VVRATTMGLAVIQAFGFVVFLDRIPGAVATPGVGFVSRTVLLLTGSSVLVGWLAELLTESASGAPVEGLQNAHESRATDTTAAAATTLV
jgi:preprotein translocase subunit SecY